MKGLMNIPKKLHVGYQKRDGTYTGKLAYVVYTDEKGKMRKETSWQNWRDKKLDQDDYDNVPTSGFVLNKGVGGTRESYGWNARNEYIRIWDPRDFEIEISVANLLFILTECDCTKGKGLEGEFVYAWDGTELVLLPTSCKEYKTSVDFTDLKSMKVTKSDMVEGYTYTAKDNEELVYLGRQSHRGMDRWGYVDTSVYAAAKSLNKPNTVKSHVFYNVETGKFRFEKGFTKLAKVSDANVHANHADYYQKFQDSEYVSLFSEIRLDPVSQSRAKASLDNWRSIIALVDTDKAMCVCLNNSQHYIYRNKGIPDTVKMDISDKQSIAKAFSSGLTSTGYYSRNHVSVDTFMKLYPNTKFYTPVVVLDSGKELKDNNYVN